MTQKKLNKAILGALLVLKLEEETFIPEKIARWADNLRYEYLGKTEPDVDGIIMDLSVIDLGEQFEMTKEELYSLAISLIAESKNNSA